MKEGRIPLRNCKLRMCKGREEGEAQDNMARQQQRRHEGMQYDLYEEIAENRSVWHVKIKAGPLLNG